MLIKNECVKKVACIVLLNIIMIIYKEKIKILGAHNY